VSLDALLHAARQAYIQLWCQAIINQLLCVCRGLPLVAVCPQGLGQAAMRWSGDPEHYPFGGSNNVFWNVWASNISVPLDYVGRLAASRPDVKDQKRRATLYMLDRPAKELGYAEVVVDMPLNQQMPSIRDVRAPQKKSVLQWSNAMCAMQYDFTSSPQ